MVGSADVLETRPVSASPFDLVAGQHDRQRLVMGVPLDGSGAGRGESRAPGALRRLGLVERLAAEDLGDLDVSIDDPRRDGNTGVIGYAEFVAASRTIRDAVGTTLAAGWIPIVVGGCCSIVPGTLAGVRRRLGPFAMAFVDGHLDLFDGRTSRTGEPAGMDLALGLGLGPAELVELAGQPPIVDASDVLAVGDGDRPRRVAFRAPGPEEVAPELRVIDCQEVKQRGAATVGRDVAEEVGGGSTPFWVHFDVDVIDGREMPAVSYPVATELSWADVETVLGPLLRSPRLIGLSVADYNPDLDADGLLGRRLVSLLATGFDR